MDFAAGTRITFENKITYEIISPIGAGGQGAVYKVKNLTDNQCYAMKVLVDENEGRREMKRKNIRILIDENTSQRADNLARGYNINHAFPLSSCSYKGETLYIMELAGGQTLNYMINENNGIIQKMPLEEKLGLARQIALSIEIINKLGGCYTDINWGNFMFDSKTGWLYVVDCENVASDQEIQQDGLSFVLGTGFFMAPEVAFGYAKAGKNADAYALANLIFRILINNLLPSPYHGKIMYSSPACQDMFGVKELADEDDIDEAWSVFIFDEKDRRNNIDDLYKDADASKPKQQKKRGELNTVIKIWNGLDNRLKERFRQAFKNPLTEFKSRPTPDEWVSVLDDILNGGSQKGQGTSNTSGATSPVPPKPKPAPVDFDKLSEFKPRASSSENGTGLDGFSSFSRSHQSKDETGIGGSPDFVAKGSKS